MNVTATRWSLRQVVLAMTRAGWQRVPGAARVFMDGAGNRIDLFAPAADGRPLWQSYAYARAVPAAKEAA